MNLFPFKNFRDFQNKLHANMEGLVDKFLGTEPKPIPHMSYEDMIEYFVKAHQQDKNIENSAVIRKSGSGKMKSFVHLTLICLDKNLDIILDRQGNPRMEEFLVGSLDSELTEALDETDGMLQFVIR